MEHLKRVLIAGPLSIPQTVSNLQESAGILKEHAQAIVRYAMNRNEVRLTANFDLELHPEFKND